MTVPWGLLLLISTFVVPQLLGVLLHFRLIRFSKWLAFALGALTPAAAFFVLAPYFFFAGLREAASRGEVMNCGMPAMAAAFMVLLGTGVQVVVGLIVHVYLLRKQSSFKPV
jgi:hypothetical protein